MKPNQITELDKLIIKEKLEFNPFSGNIRWKSNIGSNKLKGKIAGCVIKRKNTNYILIKINKKFHYAHRIAWFLFYNKFPQNQIDHINHNGADNRIINLREATQAQNNQNQRNVKGICFHKAANKWMSFIKVNQKLIYLGLYKTQIEALRVRKEYEKQFNWNQF